MRLSRAIKLALVKQFFYLTTDIGLCFATLCFPTEAARHRLEAAATKCGLQGRMIQDVSRARPLLQLPSFRERRQMLPFSWLVIVWNSPVASDNESAENGILDDLHQVPVMQGLELPALPDDSSSQIPKVLVA